MLPQAGHQAAAAGFGAAAPWFGITDIALLPREPGRLLWAELISALLLVAVSWYFTRWLTRPLEELRSRMQSHRPGEPTLPLAAGPLKNCKADGNS